MICEISADEFLLGFVMSVQRRWIKYDRLTRACISPGVSALYQNTMHQREKIQRARAFGDSTHKSPCNSTGLI
jgi:hypothetical protein